MTFNWSKEEVASLALKSPKATVLLDAVEWVISLESLDSSETTTSLAASAVGGVMSVSAIAFGFEVVVFATFTFFEGSTIGSVCQLDLFGLRLSDRFHENYYRKQHRDGINNLFNVSSTNIL